VALPRFCEWILKGGGVAASVAGPSDHDILAATVCFVYIHYIYNNIYIYVSYMIFDDLPVDSGIYTVYIIYIQLYTYLLFVQTHIVLALGVTRLDWQMSGLCRDLLPYDTTMGRLSPTESMVVPADVFKSEGVENQNRRSIGTPMT